MQNSFEKDENKKVGWEIPIPRASASRRLFCFPYSGGSPASFMDWVRLLPESIEVCVLDAPGKGKRFNMQPYDSMELLSAAILENTEIFTSMPFSFLGHSMGAWVATDLCWRLEEQGLPLPDNLIVSGSPPLALKRLPPYVHQMTDDKLVEELRILGGTAPEVLNDREFMKQFFPGIRADFKILETYQCKYKSPLPIDLSIWCGIDDPRVPASVGQFWSLLSTRSVTERFFEGGHMFIAPDQSQRECLAEIQRILLKPSPRDDVLNCA